MKTLLKLFVGMILGAVLTLYYQPIIEAKTKPMGASPQICYSGDGLPDPKCNHPVQNNTIFDANLKDTICKKGFTTASIRPPTSYTNPIKTQKMKDYGMNIDPSLVELDHLQPLLLAGDPRNPDNLWPELYDREVDGYNVGAHTKDKLEVKIKPLLCSGKMTLKDVQTCFADWIACYKQRVGELPKYVPIEIIE